MNKKDFYNKLKNRQLDDCIGILRKEIQDGVQTLTINFSLTEYRFVVEQYGANLEDGEQYSNGFIYNDESGTENDYFYTVLKF